MQQNNYKDNLQSICDKAKKMGANFADVRVVVTNNTSIVRQDGRADKLSQSDSLGLGIRVLKNGAWGFASVSDFNIGLAFTALQSAVEMAEASVGDSDGQVFQQSPIEDYVYSKAQIDPRTVSVQRKMDALKGYEDAAMKETGDKLVNSVLNYIDRFQKEIVCNTFGTYVESSTIRTYLNTLIVVKDGSVLQKGRARMGQPIGFELVEATKAEDFSVIAAQTACRLLNAKLPPAGKFPVVFHPSVTGLLTHEATGHNAEADHILAGSSIIAGKVGEKIASELVTIIDDALIPNKWGSYVYDSEGTPASKRVIIEKGILKQYMHSLETAAKMGCLPNGSARAQDYESRPIIRMSNTYIEPGNTSFADMIRDIDLGIYLKGGEYGHVLCERGQFTGHAGEAYMIRNGEICEMLRDVSFAGMTLDTLANVDAVSNDFEMAMPGMCGKDGQGMYVDNGGPHIRVKEVVIGGQS